MNWMSSMSWTTYLSWRSCSPLRTPKVQSRTERKRRGESVAEAWLRESRGAESGGNATRVSPTLLRDLRKENISASKLEAQSIGECQHVTGKATDKNCHHTKAALGAPCAVRRAKFERIGRRFTGEESCIFVRCRPAFRKPS
jgi:hypothetical protein